MESEIIAHTRCQEAIALESKIGGNFLELAARLYEIKGRRLYETEYTTWGAFCEEFRSLSISSISKLLTVYELYVLKYQIEQEKLITAGGWSLLYKARKMAQTKEEAERIIDELGIQASSHARSHAVVPYCDHVETYQVTVCKDCGKWLQ